jgi:serine/threonine protein kinase
VSAGLGPELPVGTKIGFYEVLPLATSADGKTTRTCLGYGGFGSLYKVSRGSKVYALKLAHRSLRDYSAAERRWNEERADREVGALKLLRHPNIVRVHAFDMWPDEDGRPFLVMDLVDGDHLDTWRATKTPSLQRICEVFIAIARALGAAHKQQVFHRDLKCENILVRAADGQPIIVDWGIARPRNARTVTAAGGWLGTCTHFSPEYCRYAVGDFPDDSPELLRFTVTTQSELHAVGFMLYELLTGESPFPIDEDDFATMRTIIAHVPVAPSSVNPNVPKELDAVVLKLLAKNPAARYESGELLAHDLDALIAKAGKPWVEPFDLGHPSAGPALLTKDPPKPRAIVPATVPDGPGADSAPRPVEISSAGSSGGLVSVEILGELPVSKPNEPHHSAIAAAAAKLRAAKEPRRLRLGPGLVAVVIAIGLAAFALLARFSTPTKKPESLLAKVEASERRATAPVVDAAQSERPQLLPPVPVLAANVTSKPAARAESEQVAKAPKLGGSAHVDEREIDREIAEKYGRPTLPQTAPAAPISTTPLPVATTPLREDVPEWLRSVGSSDARPLNAGAKVYGVPTGALVRARLQSTLDSRTVADGPVTVKLMHPFVVEGKAIFPSGTLAFGQGASSGSRFTIRFNRLRLPDRTEVPFEGLAYSIAEREPGLAAARSVQPNSQQASVAGQVAKGAASTLLTAADVVTGGNVAAAVGTQAGQTALNAPGAGSTALIATLTLDQGADLDIFIAKAF